MSYAPAFVTALAIAISGVLGLLIGRRGRRIGDHPTCRACGFDLTGKPHTSPRCPECGADVTRPRAIARGRVQRSTTVIVAAALLLVLGLSTSTIVAVRFLRDPANIAVYPSWVLARQIRGSNGTAATEELTRRLLADGLNADITESVVTRLLKLQADRTVNWDWVWGNFLWVAREKGYVSDGQWSQYAANTTDFRFMARRVVRSGDPLPYIFAFGASRAHGLSCAGGYSPAIPFEYELVATWINPPRPDGFVEPSATNHLGEPEFQFLGDGDRPFASISGQTYERFLGPAWYGEATRGPFELKVEIGYTIRHPHTRATLARGVTALSAMVRITPPNEPSSKAVVDPTLRDAMTKFVFSELQRFDHKGRNRGWFGTTNPPVRVAAELFARGEEGIEYRLGGWGRRYIGSPLVLPRELSTARQVDIILRPSLDAAIRQLDVFDYWGEEIVVENLPVRDDP